MEENKDKRITFQAIKMVLRSNIMRSSDDIFLVLIHQEIY